MTNNGIALIGVMIIRSRAHLGPVPLPWHIFERIEYSAPELIPGIHYLDIPRGYQRSYGL